MLSQLLRTSMAGFAKAMKDKSVRQRRKHYGKFPDKYKLITRIRPPDLKDPDIKFPIRIPIRYRHIFCLKKQLVVPNSSKIHWNRLQPNEILLGFEKIQYLTFEEIVEGLKFLSEVKGQQEHDWNKHEWVSTALQNVKENMKKIKKTEIMDYYYLFKKLRYSDEEFWKKMYAKIERNIYEISTANFSYIYTTYYDSFQKVFSPESRKNLEKLMEGKLRSLNQTTILRIFQFFVRDNKLNTYWLQNVFISLFKQEKKNFTASQIVQIFRFMMTINHEKNERFYANLYNRIEKYNYKSINEAQELQEMLLQVKQLFKSHRVDHYLQFIATKKKELKQKKVDQKKKTIDQMVRDDLKYFMQKRKLKALEKGTQTSSTATQQLK